MRPSRSEVNLDHTCSVWTRLALTDPDVQLLPGGVRGAVLRPGGAVFKQASSFWNLFLEEVYVLCKKTDER